MAQRMAENKFDMNDFLTQVEQMSKLGSMGSMMKLLTGMSQITDKQIEEAEERLNVLPDPISHSPMTLGGGVWRIQTQVSPVRRPS